MRRSALDIYDDMPRAMKRYLSNYGWHFNKLAFEYAVSLMKKKSSSGKEERVPLYSKELYQDILKKYSVVIENDTMYDGMFVFEMGIADYLGSSIADENHLVLYVKDTIDDIDASSETTFRRWVATMVGNGNPIPWEDFV